MHKLSNGADSGILHVQWILTREYDYGFAYCPDQDWDGNCIYIPSRLLRMAQQILSLPRKRYEITLGGGEPALHPFFQDIIEFILRTRRKVLLRIETNGIRPFQFYADLAKRVQKGMLEFVVTIHPAKTEIGKFLEMIAGIDGLGQRVHIRMLRDPLNKNAMRMVYKALRGIQNIVSYTFEWISMPILARPNTILNNNYSKRGKVEYEKIVLLNESGAIVESAPKSENRYYIPSAHYLYIDPDGFYYRTPSRKDRSKYPLWHERADLSGLEVLPYSESDESICNPDGIFCFDSRQEAEAWVVQFKKDILRWDYCMPPLPGAELDARQKIRNRLRRLQPDKLTDLSISIPRHEEAAWLHMDTITQVYNLLTEDQSKNILLAAIRSMETGNSSYLAEASKASTESADENNVDLSFINFTESPTFADIEAIRTRIRFEPMHIYFPLPWDPSDFLSILKLFLLEFPEYRVRLEITDGVVSVRALSRRKIIRHPLQQILAGCDPEKLEDRPDISIILYCRNDHERLPTVLDSILTQRGASIQLIVVDHHSQDASRDILATLRSNDTVSTTVLSLPAENSIGQAWCQGVLTATGNAIIFMTCQISLPPGFLFETLKEWTPINAAIAAIPLNILYPDGEIKSVIPRANDTLQVEVLLSTIARGYDPCACLFSSDILFLNPLYLSILEEFGLLALICAALSLSVKGIILDGKGMDKAGYYRLTAYTIEEVLRMTTFLADLADENSDKSFKEAANSCALHLLEANLGVLLKEAYVTGNISDSVLNVVDQVDGFTKFVLGQYALFYCESMGLPPKHPKFAVSENHVERISYAPYADGEDVYISHPDISVIIITDGEKEHTSKAVMSVLLQLRNTDELIIVDNHSGDGTWEMLQDLADMYPEVHLWRMSNHTNSTALQRTGLDNAKGTYILFLDAYSEIVPDMLEQVLRKFTEVEADAYIYAGERISVDGNKIFVTPPGDGWADPTFLKMFLGSQESGAWLKVFRQDMALQLVKENPEVLPELIFLAKAFDKEGRTLTSNKIGLISHDSLERFSVLASDSIGGMASALWLLDFFVCNGLPIRDGINVRIKHSLLPEVAGILADRQESAYLIKRIAESRTLLRWLMNEYAQDLRGEVGITKMLFETNSALYSS